MDQKLALSWKMSTGHFAVYIFECSIQNKNLRREIHKKAAAACWTTAIHSHTEKAWSYNTDLLPIHILSTV